MSNYNYYRANMISAISLHKNMEQLRLMLSNMEQSYKLWCHQVDFPIKYRKYNQYQLYDELFKASEIHEERRERSL